MTGVSILDTFCYPDKAVSYVAEHSYAGMNKWSFWGPALHWWTLSWSRRITVKNVVVVA